MKSWLSNWKRRRETNVAAELRASKPEPSARFVKTLAARINPRPVAPVRTRTRLGLAAAVTATMVAVVGATGGFSSAASTIAGATHSVAHITHVSSTPSALVRNALSPSKAIHPRSADGQYAVAPTITDFSPDSGAPGITVTVDGTNFIGASAVTSVTLNGTPAAYNVSSNTVLTFTVPAGATSGVIEVSNAAGSADSDTFTVIQTPQFDGDTPFSPTHGGAGTPVTLNGTHFTGVTKVVIGGKSAPINDLSDTEIDTAVPAGATPGDGSITVTNAAGSASAGVFTVDSGAPGNIAFSPSSGIVGASIKITGKNLDVNNTPADVMFSGAADAASLTDGKTPTNTAIWVDVPADATSGPITVSNDAGSATSSASFIVLAQPHVSGLSPAFGIAGTSVVITGDTFTHAQNVIFHSGGGDVTVSSGLSIKGDTQITVSAPSGLTKGTTYTLEVTGKTGQTSDPSSDTFYFEAKPAIDSLTPDTGAAGKEIAITPAAGNTFLGAKKVTFGGTLATITSNTPSQIKALVPKGLVSGTTASKDVPVVVSNAAGNSPAATFTVLNTAPTVKTLAPTAGEAGDQVTITGKNLNNPDTTVTFLGGSNCTVANADLTKSTNTAGTTDTISFDVPDCARTGALRVDNADGSVTTAPFTVYLQPVVFGPSPAYGISGTPITVQGAPGTFVGAYEVDFGSAAQTKGIVVAKDGGSLKVNVPKDASKNPLAPGTYQITVKVNKADGDLSGNSGNTGFTVVAAPANLAFTDAGGTASHSFTLTGDNLLGITKVKFGSVQAVFQQVVTGGAVDPHQLIVYVPAGATSSKIKVFNAATSSGVSTSAIYPILAIKNVSPASTKHGKAATITVTGSGFKFGGSLATLQVGADTVTPKPSSTDTSLLFALPLDLAAGDQTIDITNSLGEVTATLTLK